jgi:hypothetical protein
MRGEELKKGGAPLFPYRLEDPSPLNVRVGAFQGYQLFDELSLAEPVHMRVFHAQRGSRYS